MENQLGDPKLTLKSLQIPALEVPLPETGKMAKVDPLIAHLDFQIVEARKALEWLKREGGMGPRARRRVDLVLEALDKHSAGSAIYGRMWGLGDKLEVDD